MQVRGKQSNLAKPNKNIAVNKGAKKTGSAEIPRWMPLGIIVLTALLYLRSLGNGFSSLDDDTYLMQNPFIRDFSWKAVKAIFSSFYFSNYHPFTTLTYLVENKLFGFTPLPYHLLNLLLHLLNTWLVFKLAQELSGKKITAAVASVLFAIHPMRVESVAWIAERKDVLYAAFFLLSLIVYLKYLSSEKKTKLYAGSLLLFLASLFSKSAAVTLPVILLGIDLYKGRKINVRTLAEKIPFFFLSLLFGILALLSQENAMVDFSYSYNFIERIFVISGEIATYLIMLVAPFNLSAFHYYPDNQSGTLPWTYYASVLFLAAIIWFIIRQKKFRKEILFAVFFFLAAISIMLQIIPVGIALTAERYTYVAYFGFFYLAGQGISAITDRQKRKTAITVLCCFVLLFSVKTVARTGVWKDGETLFSDVIEKYPTMFHGYWMRGNLRNTNGNLQGALDDYNQMAKYNTAYAHGFIDRGAVRIKLNDIQGALEDLSRSIQLDSSIAKAYNNRAAAYEQVQNPTAAMMDYNKAILLDPELTEAYINRSVLKAKTGDMKGALQDINTSISIDPNEADAYIARGTIKSMVQDYKSSMDDMYSSLKLRPNDTVAYYNLGMLNLFLKDTANSCVNFQKAAQLGGTKAAAAAMQFCR